MHPPRLAIWDFRERAVSAIRIPGAGGRPPTLRSRPRRRAAAEIDTSKEPTHPDPLP